MSLLRSSLFDALPPEMKQAAEQAEAAAKQGDIDTAMEILQSLMGGMTGDADSLGFDPDDLEDEDDEFDSEFPLCSPAAEEILSSYFESEDETDEGLRAASYQALRVDPYAIEALVMLGDDAESLEERVDLYRRASAAVEYKDPDLVREYMPELRMEMASNLASDGRVADAAEILAPALDEDPRDPLGLRWVLTDFMLRLGWDDDLYGLLGPFKDEPIGTTPFARALLQFRQSGPSPEADELLRAADDLNPNVYPLLSGLRPLPPEASDTFAPGSDEEASMIAHFLLPAWRGTPGAVAWIRDTLDDGTSHGDSGDDSFGDNSFFGDDPLTVALDLPVGDDEWFLYTAQGGQDDMVVVIRDSQQRVVAIDQYDQKPSVNHLRDFFIAAIAEPYEGPRRKPRCLYVPTKALLGALKKMCGTVGVECQQRKPSKQEREHVAKFATMLGQQSAAEEESVDIASLPQVEETWLYGLFHPPLWITDRATPRRGWIQLVLDATNGCVQATEVTDDRPSPIEMAHFAGRSMSHPAIGEPRRPQQLLVDPCESASIDPALLQTWRVLTGKLDDAEIFTEIVRDMLGRTGPMEGSLLESEGVDATTLARLYEACAQFYRAAPWRMIPGDALIDLTCAGWDNPTWTACVIGQMGQELGLSLFENPDEARRTMQTGEMNLGQMRCLVAHFDEAFNAIPGDVWNLERHDWALASPEAYPFIARFNPGGKPLRPSASDLQVLEIALNHLPRFLDLPRGETLTIRQPHPDQAEPVVIRWVE